jgi:hypothetical protein
MVTVMQRQGKHISAATNSDATTEDAMFSVLPLLGSGMVNMFPQQQINIQQ